MISLRTLSVALLTGITLLGATASLAAPPEIIAGTNREAEVIFKGNNCVVYYRRNGTRREANRNCRNRQINRADRSMSAFRREQGWDRQTNRHSNRHGRNVGRAIGAAIAIGLAAAIANKNKHQSRCDRTFHSCKSLHGSGTRRFDRCMHRRSC